jgi:hypothetical protein
MTVYENVCFHSVTPKHTNNLKFYIMASLMQGFLFSRGPVPSFPTHIQSYNNSNVPAYIMAGSTANSRNVAAIHYSYHCLQVHRALRKFR